MVGHFSVHRAYDGNLVDHAGRMRKDFAHLDTALTITLELVRGRESGTRLALGTQILGGEILPGIFFEQWFGVESVDVRRPAIHEQVNDMLGTGRKMGRAGCHRVGHAAGRARGCFRAKQTGEPKSGQAHAGTG